jgi:hypothetical protein
METTWRYQMKYVKRVKYTNEREFMSELGAMLELP